MQISTWSVILFHSRFVPMKRWFSCFYWCFRWYAAEFQTTRTTKSTILYPKCKTKRKWQFRRKGKTIGQHHGNLAHCWNVK